MHHKEEARLIWLHMITHKKWTKIEPISDLYNKKLATFCWETWKNIGTFFWWSCDIQQRAYYSKWKVGSRGIWHFQWLENSQFWKTWYFFIGLPGHFFLKIKGSIGFTIWVRKFEFGLVEEFRRKFWWLNLDGNLKLDVEMRLPGDGHNVGELAGEPGRFVQVVNGQDLQTAGSDHHLGLVNVGPLYSDEHY